MQDEGIGIPILIGRPEIIQRKIEEMALDLDCKIVDPDSFERFEEYVKAYHELRARKGMVLPLALKRVREPNVFGPMMVKMGDADAYVAGLTHEYPEVIKPTLQIHRTRAGARLVTGVYIMIFEDRVFLFTDATVNIEPTSEDLAEIAVRAAEFAKQLELEPRIAFLSFSNFRSTDHPLSAKVRKAVELVKKNYPDLVVDGEMQADTAVVPEIIDQRYPFSRSQGCQCAGLPVARIRQHCLQTAGTSGQRQSHRPDPARHGCAHSRPADRRRGRFHRTGGRCGCHGCLEPQVIPASRTRPDRLWFIWEFPWQQIK